MLEIIKIIALLCQIGSGDKSAAYLQSLQLECQQKYVKCVRAGKNDTLAEDLEACILEQK